MTDLDRAWGDYLTTLERLAPRTRAAIKPAGSVPVGLLDSAADAMSDETRSWFTVHGGAGFSSDGMFAPDNILMRAEEAVADTLVIREIWEEDEERPEEVGQAGEVMQTWMPQYLMIGTDTCGGGLFVDGRPGDLTGCVRHWDKTEADSDYGAGVVATSITDLLERLHIALGTSTPFVGGRSSFSPVVDAGVLSWALQSDPRPHWRGRTP